MNWMTLIASLAVIAALAAVFVWWRWKNCLRRREPMGQETTWVMYLPAAVLFGFLTDNMPDLSLAIKLGAVAVMFALGAVPVWAVSRRYEKALEQALEEDKEALWK
jgi:Zn-dependent membrane protease YugP